MSPQGASITKGSRASAVRPAATSVHGREALLPISYLW